MNNLSFFILGLVLIPACLSEKKCFSQSLKPSYPCCNGNVVIYTDESGDWGIEDGQWCGISSDHSSETCFAASQGYACCKENKVVYTDESGDWGIENGQWCGISNSPSEDSCFAAAEGYPCCESCEVSYSDESGNWGIENGKWCGIKDSCSTNIEIKGNTDFDFAFLKLENRKQNMLYSPFSIKYALKMLQEGAVNNTYTEISNVIGNTQLTKYTSIDDALSFANGLIIKDRFYKYIRTEYMNKLKEKYDAEVKEDAFTSAENINKWIEEKTFGIIKDMLKDSDIISPDLIMVIANALAIDMEWVDQFSYRSTGGRSFYKEDGEEMKATMMYKKETFSKYVSYYKDDETTVLSMDLKDYYGTQFEFMAIMPEENLSTFVKNVSIEQINHIDENLKLASDTKYGVNVEIPKFKFDYELDLKNDLMSLGIKDAFDKNKAEFPKMADEKAMDRHIFVSNALHKADIEFTEKGVKAAAVTVIIVTGATAPRPEEKYPIDIIINKPFMFVIRDKKTKDIWFTGTVYNPNLWENDKSSYDPYKRY